MPARIWSCSGLAQSAPPGNVAGESVSAILNPAGNRKVAATSAMALSVTTPAMYALRDRGIDASYVRAIIRTVAAWRLSQVIAPNVLEAPKRSSASECDHGDARERDHDAGQFGPSWSVLPALDDGFGIHARSSFAALVSSGTRKPTRLIGRSVALLALPHPKCPFQVELLRVRASYCCFLVLGYYEVPGLYGCRTEPVNTAPYLSLDSVERRRLDIRAVLAWRLRSARTVRRRQRARRSPDTDGGGKPRRARRLGRRPEPSEPSGSRGQSGPSPRSAATARSTISR